MSDSIISLFNFMLENTKGKTRQLGQCKCYWATLPQNCNYGDLMQGFDMDDAEHPYHSTYCCTPCFIWQSSSFSNTLDPQQIAKKESLTSFIKAAEKRNRATPSKVPCSEGKSIIFDNSLVRLLRMHPWA